LQNGPRPLRFEVNRQTHTQTEKRTVTRIRESHAIAGWMQAILESDEDLLAEVLRVGVQALMEAERDTYVNADPFARSGGRRTHRNGYQSRQLRTRVGVLQLKVPKTRDGGFYPSILERYQRSEAALITALAECYVQGVSTRKVSRICEELFGEGHRRRADRCQRYRRRKSVLSPGARTQRVQRRLAAPGRAAGFSEGSGRSRIHRPEPCPSPLLMRALKGFGMCCSEARRRSEAAPDVHAVA